MLKKILIALAIALLILLGAGLLAYRKVAPGIREAEARIEEQRKRLQPGIVVGGGSFQSRVFYSDERVGNISQIKVGWPADREGADIAIVGSRGTDFLDMEGEAKKQVRFSIEQGSPVEVARRNSAGDYGYITRDQSWSAPVTLFDKDGQVVWRTNSNWSGVDDAAPVDISGEGNLSVAVGLNGDGGIVLVDSQGQTLWKKSDGNVWHVEGLDVDGDGRQEVLHSNARGQLLVRNAKGDVVTQYLPGAYVSGFTLTRWGAELKPTHILVPISEGRGGCCAGIFTILDAGGRKVAERESPLGEALNRTAATSVKFRRNDDSFAVLQNNFAAGRSVLVVYRGDGQISYQEILAEVCGGIAAVPIKDGETLLIGCAGKVLEYFPAER